MSNELAAAALEAQIRLELESEHGIPRWRRPPVAPDDYAPTRRSQEARRATQAAKLMQDAWGSAPPMSTGEQPSPDADGLERDQDEG